MHFATQNHLHFVFTANYAPVLVDFSSFKGNLWHLKRNSEVRDSIPNYWFYQRSLQKFPEHIEFFLSFHVAIDVPGARHCPRPLSPFLSPVILVSTAPGDYLLYGRFCANDILAALNDASFFTGKIFFVTIRCFATLRPRPLARPSGPFCATLDASDIAFHFYSEGRLAPGQLIRPRTRYPLDDPVQCAFKLQILRGRDIFT